MPIKIPSKRIYDINHNIIRKTIGSFSTTLNDISIIEQENGINITQSIDVSGSMIGNYYKISSGDAIFKQASVKKSQNVYYNVYETSTTLAQKTSGQILYSDAAVSYLPISIRIYEDAISDRLIKKLYNAKDENYPLKYTTTYVYIERNVTGTCAAQTLEVSYKPSEGFTYYDNDLSGPIGSVSFGISDNFYSDPKLITNEGGKATYNFTFDAYSFTPTNGTGTVKYPEISNTVSLVDSTQLETAKWTTGTEKGKNYFEIDLTIPCAKQGTTLLNDDFTTPYANANVIETLTRQMSGTMYLCVATTIKVLIYGVAILLSINEQEFGIGDNATNNAFSIDNNELMQTTPSIKEAMSTVYEVNKNGKETVTLKCSVNDYYDYDSGEKVIDVSTADKMLFEVDDEVIPMKMTANGTELPLSTNPDGTPKVYRVVGVEQSQGGIIWQTLTLIEKTT